MDAGEFIESYRATWDSVIRGRTGIDDLTGFFHLPCLMVALDGTVTEYREASQIRAFNRSRLDAFLDGSAHHARLRGLDVQGQGPHLSLAIVNWELLRADGTVERAWRHYYTLWVGVDRMRILVSAFQIGA